MGLPKLSTSYISVSYLKRSFLPGEPLGFHLLFILFVLWQIVGILPLRSYEGDAISIAGACEYAYKSGRLLISEVGYGYWMQPLTYLLIYYLHHLFTSCSCETIYCFVSALCAIGLQYFAILLAHKLCSLDRRLILAALFLLPESFALSMYPNSTAIAGLFIFAAFGLLSQRRLWPAVFLLMVAPGFRLDVLMIYIVVPFLFYKIGMPAKRNLMVTALIALAVVLSTLFIFKITGGDISYTLAEYSRWAQILPPQKRILAVTGFYGLSIFLVFGGIIITYLRRKYFILIIGLVPLIFVHIIEFRFGNAAKHFALLIPFAIIFSSFSLRQIFKSGRLISVSALVLIMVYELTGLRFSYSPQIPHTLLNSYAPTICSSPFSINGKKMEAVVGAGQVLMTADEMILTSGEFFYPWVVQNIKKESIRREQELIKMVAKPNHPVIAVFGWENRARICNLEFTGKISSEDYTILKSPNNINREYFPMGLESTCHRWDNTVNLYRQRRDAD